MNKLFLLLIVAILYLSGYKAQAQVLEPPLDNIHPTVDSKNLKPVPYQYVREANVMWQKRIWRIIDMHEKINEPFYFPRKPANGRKNFMYIVLDALKEGTITPYECAINNDEFLVPQTPDQVLGTLSKTDTLRNQQRPYPPYAYYDTVIKKDFDPSSVSRFRLKEDWFLDRERSVMDVRIIGLCPTYEKFDDVTGESRGDVAMFWIYFDEARPIFAKTQVFNRFNAAERRSYDDIFFKRMFGSYIYKEENVFDRTIQSYTGKSIEQLLESDRIKDDLFRMEHDLWEY